MKKKRVVLTRQTFSATLPGPLRNQSILASCAIRGRLRLAPSRSIDRLFHVFRGSDREACDVGPTKEVRIDSAARLSLFRYLRIASHMRRPRQRMHSHVHPSILSFSHQLLDTLHETRPPFLREILPMFIGRSRMSFHGLGINSL